MKLTHKQELTLGLSIILFLLLFFLVTAPIVYARNSDKIGLEFSQNSTDKTPKLFNRKVSEDSLTAKGVFFIRPTFFEDAIKARDKRIAKAKEKKRLAKIKAARIAEAKRLAQIAAQKRNTLRTPVYASSSNPAILQRIKMCESGGNYTAQNPTSTASGAYQFVDGTWANYVGYSKAKYAPPQPFKTKKPYLLTNQVVQRPGTLLLIAGVKMTIKFRLYYEELKPRWPKR